MARLWVWLREDVWEIRFRRYIALTLAAVLVGLGVWGGMTVTKVDRSCAPGVVRPKGSDECVGVSSTAYDFGRSQFTDAVRAIDHENRLLKPGSYVTVALLEPFTATDADNIGDVLHELQGVYLAQYQANHDTNGLKPKIRLVLANPGATGASWRHTVDQLVRMAKGPDRLRAVTGVGSSTENNKKAVAKLTRRNIPVIGSSITADDLADGQNGKDTFPGLARVSPTNTDEARALASFAKVSAANAFLVYDQPGDPYTRTLQTSFERMLKDGSNRQPFTPPADRSKEGSTANVFMQITTILCSTPKTTDTVLFAGRHTQLRQFINALGERGCSDHSFTVLTGDEGSYLAGDKRLAFDPVKDPRLKVRYTALAHPEAWLGGGAPATGGSAAAAKALQGLLDSAAQKPVGPIGRTSLDDGQLIIAYDAMLLTVHGIRGASPNGQIPALTDVGHQWPQVKGSLRVNGASGWICLDIHGNPYDKAVPIVELTDDSHTHFVKIGWPEGEPPTAECLPRS